jgi:hypothetical protein
MVNGTQKIDESTRHEICRQWARALPSERVIIAKNYGISTALPGYWRRKNLWPKDITVPVSFRGSSKPEALEAKLAAAGAQPPPAETPPPGDQPALKVKPRNYKVQPYTQEERLAIKAEHTIAQGEGQRAIRAFTKKWGRFTWLYAGHKVPAPLSPASPELQARIMREVAEKKAADPKRKIADIWAETVAAHGLRNMHWGTYYDWKKRGIGKRAAPKTAKKAPAVAAVIKAKAKKKIGAPSGAHKTIEEKMEIVRRVTEMRAGGMTLKQACARLSIKRDTYLRWSNGQNLGVTGRPRKGAEVIEKANAALAMTNGTYLPAKRAAVQTIAGQLGEVFRRLRAMGTIVTKVETDADGGVVRITTQTTETIEL